MADIEMTEGLRATSPDGAHWWEASPRQNRYPRWTSNVLMPPNTTYGISLGAIGSLLREAMLPSIVDMLQTTDPIYRTITNMPPTNSFSTQLRRHYRQNTTYQFDAEDRVVSVVYGNATLFTVDNGIATINRHHGSFAGPMRKRVLIALRSWYPDASATRETPRSRSWVISLNDGSGYTVRMPFYRHSVVISLDRTLSQETAGGAVPSNRVPVGDGYDPVDDLADTDTLRLVQSRRRGQNSWGGFASE